VIRTNQTYPWSSVTANQFIVATITLALHTNQSRGPSWSWSYGSWIYNYLCNQCLSPLMLWVRISMRARCPTLCDKVCQWLATGRWFSPGPPVYSTNKTDRHDITEILLKVALNTIKQTSNQYKSKVQNDVFNLTTRDCWFSSFLVNSNHLFKKIIIGTKTYSY